MIETIKRAVFPTPWGWGAASTSPKGLRRLIWPLTEEADAWAAIGEGVVDADILTVLSERLNRYFSGEKVAWDFPLDPQGTPFQQAVWRQTSAVPLGQTCTYGYIAQAIKRPRSARAVGQALRANPIPLIIPCHRVVGSDGSLCGYNGPAGITLKARLLELERTAARPP